MYRVRLEHFEGPLDLLLFFIKRDELDIYDIPISHITKEFFDYMHLIEQLDLEIAGDFILMASTLMQIKVRMLLPKEVDEKGEEIDPRTDLVNALLEYKRYKEMAEEFSFLEQDQLKRSFRSYYEADPKDTTVDVNTVLKNVTLYDLIKAFKKAIDEKPKEETHQIQRLNVTIDEQMEYIINRVNEKNKINFVDLARNMREKIRIIVTFIALLELIKMGRIGLEESFDFNDFVIYKMEDGESL